MMTYPDLGPATRKFMLEEFEKEEGSGSPYRSPRLTHVGREAFADHMRAAIQDGSEVSLAAGLLKVEYWQPTETYVRDGVVRERKVNMNQAGEMLALTEFSTWYVRGLACQLLAEGIEECVVVRGGEPKWSPAGCQEHEGDVVKVRIVLDGHRARYWPEPGDDGAYSIPFGPGCHHIIARRK